MFVGYFSVTLYSGIIPTTTDPLRWIHTDGQPLVQYPVEVLRQPAHLDLKQLKHKLIYMIVNYRLCM